MGDNGNFPMLVGKLRPWITECELAAKPITFREIDFTLGKKRMSYLRLMQN